MPSFGKAGVDQGYGTRSAKKAAGQTAGPVLKARAAPMSRGYTLPRAAPWAIEPKHDTGPQEGNRPWTVSLRRTYDHCMTADLELQQQLRHMSATAAVSTDAFLMLFAKQSGL